jgi:hypothetical protein
MTTTTGPTLTGPAPASLAKVGNATQEKAHEETTYRTEKSPLVEMVADFYTDRGSDRSNHRANSMAHDSTVSEKLTPSNTTNATEEKPQQIDQLPWSNATTANATNATTQSVEFAQPTGWGKLWRIEKNGKYFFYRLRFTDSADTPKELRRVTRPGGRLTPEIEKFSKRRPGSGRHKKSRIEADRYRSRALTVAVCFRSGVGSGTVGEDLPDGARGESRVDDRTPRREGMPQLPSLDLDERMFELRSERIN